MSDFRPRLLAAVLEITLFAALSSATAGSAVAGEQPAAQGRDVYLRYCARCHQRDGAGVENLYPSLRDAARSWDDRQDPIRTVLAGRTSHFEMGGARFDSVMPTHGYLGNETVAAALSYVVTAWADDQVFAQPFTAEEVAAVRLELLSDHPAPFDPTPGPSPLAEMGAVQYVTTEGPPMSVEDFERARRLYYGRCTGCHGVLRQGTAGNPLTPELMRERGTEYIKSVISYGSSKGMPDWGTSNTLSGEDITLLAQFLQHPVPQPPDMDAYQIRDGWRQYRAPADRPDEPAHDYDLDQMLVVALHDVGEIALIDGATRSVITRVPVGGAPHRITASSSGRYLYVICRDGTLAMVDLYAAPPERVASVRIGYEARAVAASRYPGFEGRYVMAGAFWPPQVVLLDGETLEPLRLISARGFTAGSRNYHPEPRVSDIAGSTRHPEFVTQIKETGHVYLLPYDQSAYQEVHDLEAVPELRAGSFSVDGRYYLTPADSNAVSVLDLETREVAAVIPARVFAGNPGTSYRHRALGPVWATTTMVDHELLVVGTDPDGHPDAAWQVVQRIEGPSSGSLFVATHPESAHLWMDTPLAADPEASQSVAVFRKHALGEGYRSLPVARWSGLDSGPRRVLQPTFSADGSEVWLVVWNPQDRASALVVVDDDTLEPVATVRAPELITPTRIYSLAALRGAASMEQDAARTGASPAGAGATQADAALYLDNCATCHGTYGEGDGPMAPELAVALKDLRYLSARNAGQFPERFVRDIIDGRAMRAAHGPEGMPVWGAEFAREGDGETAEAKIDALVEFLRRMQKER